ncbi:MAG: hypothetical protein ACE5MM_09790, partial [Nitrospiraceae bacterium]
VFGIHVAITIVCAISMVYGQKETERYIPLGQSPGLSQKYTLIGEIQEVDAEARSVTVRDPSGLHTVTLTDRTKIWLDRTLVKLTNLEGNYADCEIGRKVEIQYEDHARRRFAEWVKVQLSAPGEEAPSAPKNRN